MSESEIRISQSRPPIARRPPRRFYFPCFCVYIFIPSQVLPNAANAPPVTILTSTPHHATLSLPPQLLRPPPEPAFLASLAVPPVSPRLGRDDWLTPSRRRGLARVTASIMTSNIGRGRLDQASRIPCNGGRPRRPHHYPYDCSTGMTRDNPFANTPSGQHPPPRGDLTVVVHSPTNIAIALYQINSSQSYRCRFV